MNLLYYGDCFTIMAEWPDACVDLVYLDPPLDSNRQYNAIYWDETGRPLPDRIEASCDRPELDEEREWAIRTLPVLMRDNGIEDATVEFWRLWMHASGNTQPQLLQLQRDAKLSFSVPGASQHQGGASGRTDMERGESGASEPRPDRRRHRNPQS